MALMSITTVTLAFSAACRADGGPGASDPAAAAAAPAPDVTAMPPAPDSATPRTSRHQPARHLTVAQSIDENVHRLARGLDLDPGQQENLRHILVDQHRQIMKLRGGNSAAPADVAGATLAIYDQSKARIRAILNDEQRKKYSADVPREGLAPAQADLQHWMDLQEAKRRNDLGKGETQ